MSWGCTEKRVWWRSTRPGHFVAETGGNRPLRDVKSEHFVGTAGSTGMFHGQLRNVPFGTWRFRGSCSTASYGMFHLEHGIAGGHVPRAAMRCSLWNVETEVRKMKRGNKLLDGPGTPSLMSVQELRLMALLRDLVGDVGQGEAADVLGIDRKTVWRSLGTGRLTPRLADALERLLLSGGGSPAAEQRERNEDLERRVDEMEGRVEELSKDTHRGLAAVQGEVKALRSEHAQEIRQLERRLAQVETRQGAQGVEEAPGPVRQPPVRGASRRKYPELATREPADDDEAAFGPAWPLIVEWRGLKDSHPNQGKGLSWLVAEERLMEVEVALLEEHGLTPPPETQPLRGLERGSQLNWRRAALYDTRRARVKRELLRRVLTLGLWRR